MTLPSPWAGLRPGRLLLGILCLHLTTTGLGAQRLPIRMFTVADGLAHDRVKCVVSDPEGFLWLCTSLGLSYFDGGRFGSVGIGDGLPHASVNDLLVAADGTYWAATNGGGVASFHPVTVDGPAFVPSSVGGPTPGSERVNTLFQESNGRLWAGTDAGLFEMTVRGRDASFDPVRLPPELDRKVVQIWALDQGPDGELWIGTSQGLLERRPTGETRRHSVAPDRIGDTVWDVWVDARGRIWIGHDRGVVVWWPREGSGGPGAPGSLPRCWSAPTSGRHRLRLPDAPGAACAWLLPGAPGAFRVRSFHGSSDGGVWLAGAGGLGRVDETGFRLYSEELGHPSAVPQSLGEDRAGNLWFGTEAHGAARLARTGLVSFGSGDGLVESRVLSLQKGRSGELYVVSPGLWIHRPADGGFESVRANLPGDTGDDRMPLTSYPTRGADGTWWFPTNRGLYRFPNIDELPELGRRQPLGPWTREDGLHGDDTWRVFPDSRGDLWISTRLPERQILTRWERSTGTFHRYSDRDGLPTHNPPVSFWESPGGDLWIGFWDGGVARYRGGSFELYDADDGVPAGSVLAFAGGPDGRLWIGGYGGLAEVVDPSSKTPTFRQVHGAENLLVVSSLAVADDGALFAGTAHGLYHIDPASGGSRHLTVSDGLAANGVRALLRDERGDLWIGTDDGLSRLDREPTPAGPPPRVLVTGVWVDGKAMPLPRLGTQKAGPFRLEDRPERVRLEVAAISHEPGGSVRLRLLSREATDRPAITRSEPSLVVSRPGPGHHELQVEAIDVHGRRSPEAAAVEIQVPRPLWLRPWFLALLTILVGGALALAHRLRVRRLLEIERVRTRIAGDLHDDLGAQLTRMSVLAEVASTELAEAPDRAASRLSEIGENARALIDAMSDIVWSIAPGSDRLESLAARIRRFVAELFEATSVRWTVEIEDADLAVAPEQRRQILLIAKEALHNVARHANATRVTVELSHTPSHLTLVVVDDGRGIAGGEEEGSGETRGGHGLGSLRNRARSLGGELEVVAGADGGTCVRLTVPLDGGHGRA